jgi:hypothetical protein
MQISPEQEAKAWEQFSRHDSCAVLHNECLKRIEELRCQLEGVAPENLQGLQSQIREVRRWLEILHSHQSPIVKKNYEHDENTTQSRPG